MYEFREQPIYAEERHGFILDLARAEGRVEVSALADSFGVSAETIRRDLAALERQGMLRRTHGGAVPMERLRFEPEVAERLATMTEEKARIARAAVAFVPSRGTILLDAGTTTGALADLLPGGRDLTVVTNGLPIASMLAAHSSMTVLMAGGRVRGKTLAAVDDLAARFIEDYAPDVAFVGTNGMTVARGLMTPDPAEATVKRAMIRNGRRVVVLADHTKVGQEHFVRFAQTGEVDVLVTDSGLGDDAAQEFEAAGVEVVRA
ncbi:MAG TPA: DeoR/GlpR family DNA-binding transcription regulator [Rubrobacteraceae bacterium]|nr:DeoR/GlpR family DNA-binding transcription regulator [Rubrobacteraceae bacterium]